MAKKASRRDVMKGVLRAGAYTAPVVLSVARPIVAAAQVTGMPTVTATPARPPGTPGVGGVVFNLIPTSGPRNQLFSFAASGLVPNARYDLRQLSAPGFPFPLILGTVTTTARGAVGFSVVASTFSAAGMYVVGIAPTGTTGVVAQFTTTVTPTGSLPTVPAILVSPTSGPAGTAFAFVAVGLLGFTRYDALLIASPMGMNTRIITETTIVSGQFDFFFDSSAFPAGTYTFGTARSGTGVVVAQVSVTLTTSGSATVAAMPMGGIESGPDFTLGG